MTRRVVITGVGCISALGNTAPEFWAACLAGQSGIGQLAGFELTGIRFQNGAQARTFDASKHFEDKQLIPLDRFAQLAVVAAREALAQSGLELTPEPASRDCLSGTLPHCGNENRPRRKLRRGRSKSQVSGENA